MSDSITYATGSITLAGITLAPMDTAPRLILLALALGCAVVATIAWAYAVEQRAEVMGR